MIRGRAGRFPLAQRLGRFTFLTTVYERTDVALFRETAACLLGQSLPFDCWVILAHGSINPDLDAFLIDLSNDQRIRIFRNPVNLGIMGGMRVCLQAATTEYV